jgi:glycosyltransferase involved in cell wall biosynthesis
VQTTLALLGERARIDFDLQHDAVGEAFSAAAIALVPSVFQEPFGRTAIEAFAGGAALITSMRGGLKEIAEGYAEPCAPPTAETIAAAITRLVEDPAQLKALGESGRKRGQTHFDIRAVTRKLDDLYETVLRERGRL